MTLRESDVIRCAECYLCRWAHDGAGADLAARRHSMKTGHPTNVTTVIAIDRVSPASSEMVELARKIGAIP